MSHRPPRRPRGLLQARPRHPIPPKTPTSATSTSTLASASTPSSSAPRLIRTPSYRFAKGRSHSASLRPRAQARPAARLPGRDRSRHVSGHAAGHGGGRLRCLRPPDRGPEVRAAETPDERRANFVDIRPYSTDGPGHRGSFQDRHRQGGLAGDRRRRQPARRARHVHGTHRLRIHVGWRRQRQPPSQRHLQRLGGSGRPVQPHGLVEPRRPVGQDGRVARATASTRSPSRTTPTALAAACSR